MKKTLLALMFGFSAIANAAPAENFTQLTMDEVQAQLTAKHSANVCTIDFQGEVGPEQIGVGVNLKSNTVVMIGYMLEGQQAMGPMFAAMSKDTAVEFARQIKLVADGDVAELVDDEFYQHEYKSSNGVTVSVEKYATKEVYIGVQDDTSLVGGYAVDIKDMSSMVADCVSTATTYLN
ncbi:hypothetical protein Aeh1ORF096c [Aeromonas phage Aeh1]|uniref:Uncharacterized protein n=1 Tax=Aeromonas phage Aeh1 TaxID=2880362 RepID=Q76YY9_9CAUD|nr:hypothetical protein Aeh1p102 [Aeromonas phage Aeh1]AAQ17757.1 hypothetical protein Aeh1ORF096c [Aeromonas phage Aeh1]